MVENDNSRILVVDDEIDIQEIISDLFEVFGFQVKTAGSGNEAISILEKESFDIIISDIRMPDGTGIDLIKFVRERDFFKPKFFFITGYSDHTIQEILELGAEGLFAKPFEAAEMRANIKKSFLSNKERWSKMNNQECEGEITGRFESVEEAKIKEKLSFGRGGFFTSHLLDGVGSGDRVKFNFEFLKENKLVSFKGHAKVVWTRLKGKGSEELPEGIGCEIEGVDGSCIDEFVDYLNAHPTRAYIPIK